MTERLEGPDGIKAAKQIRLKADHAQTLFNGALEGLLYEYSLKKLP